MIDLINGGFALLSSAMGLVNVWCLYRDKTLSGSSIWNAVFFAVWGCWAFYFYIDLQQWASAIGCGASTIVQGLWVAMAQHYRRANGVRSKSWSLRGSLTIIFSGLHSVQSSRHRGLVERTGQARVPHVRDVRRS